jgi:3-hydroxybutyryl-CoA dehydratase
MSAKHGYYLEDITAGMEATFSKTVNEADIVQFAEISGDDNPVHLDEDFAVKTIFKGRIAHGMLSAAFISTVLGTRLPGPGCIYLHQNLKFRAPVRIGDEVEAKVVVTEVNSEKRRVFFDTSCRVGDTVVLAGDASMMVDRRPAAG